MQQQASHRRSMASQTTTTATSRATSVASVSVRERVLYTLQERVSSEAGRVLMVGARMSGMRQEDPTTWASIKDTVTVAHHMGGYVMVEYYLDPGQEGFGRMKARVLADGTRAVPYVRMKRDVRAHLASPFYWDVDMVNCQPALFRELLERHSIASPLLDRYITDREACITDVVRSCGVDRDAAKNLFIRLMYFGGINSWAEATPGAVADDVPAWVHALKEELKRNAEKLLCHDKFVQLKKYYASRAMLHELELPPGCGSKTASLVALYLQTLERECIGAVVDAIQEDARAVGGIIYDGVLVEREPGEEGLSPEQLRKWAAAAREKTGFPVSLAVKPMTLDPAWLEPAAHGAVAEGGGDSWDDSWMDGSVHLPYEEMKDRWERRSFKVIKGGNYVREDPHERVVMSEKQLVDSYRHLAYVEFKATGKAGVTMVTKPFIARWLNDKAIRVHKELVVAPPPLTPPAGSYNLWTDVAVARYQPTRPVDKGSPGVKAYLKLIHALCGHSAPVIQYLLDWMAQIFQQPASKTGVAIILKGEEGVGKNRLTDLLRGMLGNAKFLQTANPSHVLYGRFTRLREGKLLMVVNETRGGDSFAAQDVIKDMITCDEFVSEGKGTNAYPIACFSRFIFTSNHDNPVKVNPDSRRYFVIDVSSELKGQTAFFTELSRHIEDEHVRYEFYHCLMDRDIQRVDWINHRPITCDQAAMAVMNLPYEHQFFKHLVMETAKQQAAAQDEGAPPKRSLMLDAIHALFEEWLVRMRVASKHDMSALKFAHKMLRLVWCPEKHTGFRGLTKERITKGTRYHLDIPVLLREMQVKNWLSADELA